MTLEQQLTEAKDEVVYHDLKAQDELLQDARRYYHKRQATKFRKVVTSLTLQIHYKGYGKD